jgi:hypothetical protein
VDEHAVGPVDALLDGRAQVVQLGQHPAAPVRDEELDGAEPVGEALRDVCAELLEPLAPGR